MRKAIALFAMAAGMVVSAQARGAVLYDGSAPGTPAAQAWLSHYSFPFGGTEVTGGGKTSYDSGANNLEHGGYSSHLISGTLVNAAFPVLDRNVGYTVGLDMKQLSESHASNDRSGVCLIALSSDLMGIQLEFWPDEIWAQSGPTFTHAEGVAFDTDDVSVAYDLTISGATYSLLANGSPILTGALRDYSSFGTPYNLPNYLFLGDDTGSARGAFEFSRFAVAVPEPMTLGLVTPLLLLRRKR
jgi:hypothetical protein